ncbi:MAG TPA: hypothetical protein DDZ51_05265 [Planctomycetaceae bacterium]|nr:hypothetical protein [Planctomycetaceae bacterium]
MSAVDSTSDAAGPVLFRIRDLMVEHSLDSHSEAGNDNATSVVVLNRISMDIPPGCRLAILGRSGSGKSTLLSILSGLRTERSCFGISGELEFHCPGGRIVNVLGSERVGDTYRSDWIGFVLSASSLLSGFSCLDNLCLPLLRAGLSRQTSRQRAGQLVDRFDEMNGATGSTLGEHLHKLPSEVSSGQLQRFAILRAMINNPAVLMADEPFSNLDPLNHRAMLKMIGEWRQSKPTERTVILVSHHWQDAIAWADYVAFLHKGNLVGGRLLLANELGNYEAIEKLVTGQLPDNLEHLA